MAKFKKGDRVRRVCGEVADCDLTPIGGINIVYEDDSNIPYGLNKSAYGSCSVIDEGEYELAEDEDCENRLTFTVGGQEFYVGQSVWSTMDLGLGPKGTELTVVGCDLANKRAIIVRETGTVKAFAITADDRITTTQPKSHEWKFGDWARHPDGGVCFVMSGVDGDGEVMLATPGNWTYLPATELTYISTAEIPA